MYAIIGGTGLTSFPELEITERLAAANAFGKPSSPLMFGRLAGTPLIFLARHGEDYSFAPHQINYRANMKALADAGVREVVAVATVGGIRADFGPEALVVPDQIIDYTWGRESSYSGASGEAGGKVINVDFTLPYTQRLREKLLTAARSAGETVHDGGCYGATQGPRLESAAEINRMERDGADLVGMTGMPEAALARELGLDYATIAVVVNHAAGRGTSKKGIDLAEVHASFGRSLERVKNILRKLVAA